MSQKGWGLAQGSSSLLPLLLLFLVAFALRVAFLDRQSLWGDEAASLSYAQSPSVSVLLERVLDTDPHPPLYYALLHLWIKVAGTSDFALRWPSLAFGLLTVPLAYAFSRRLSRQTPLSLLLALFTALSPFLVYYSQEARMYSMAAFLSLLSLYALVRAVGSGGWWWLVYGVAGTAALYTLSLTISLIAAASAFALFGLFHHWWKAPQQVARWLLGSTLAILAAFLLWQALQVGQFGQFVAPETLSRAPLLAVDTLKELALVNVFGLTVDPSYSAARIYQDRSTWEQVYQPSYTTAAAALVLGLAVWGLLSARPKKEPSLTWLLVLGLVAVWGAAYFLRLATSRYAPRLTLIGAPFFLLLLSLGLAALPGWALRSAVVLALVAGMGYALWQNYQNPAFSRSEYRVLAQYLAQEMEPGDGVYLHGPPLRLLHSHYLSRPHPVYSIPGSVPVPYNWEEVREQLQSLAQRRPRLWLVLGGEGDYDPQRLVESWLLENGYQVEDQWFGNSRLALFLFPEGEGGDSFPGRQVGKELVLAGSVVGQGEALTPGQGLPLALTWRLLSPPQGDYRLSLRLTDGEGNLWAQRDMELGTYLNPASRWPVGQMVTTKTGLRLPPGTPPGDYLLRAVVYESSGQTLPGGELGVVPVRVGLGPPVSAQRLRPPNRAGTPLGSLRVIGYHFPQKVRPGERALLRLYWTTEEVPSEDYSLVIRLGSGPEQVVPLLPGYPTSRWRRGEALVSQHPLLVPAGAAGRLPLSLGLAGQAGVGVLPLAQVEVAEVRRSFQEPRVQWTHKANLGGKVELIGLDLDRSVAGGDATRLAPGATLGLTLQWRALKEMDISYTVFVQLLDGQGRLVAQEDALPQGGQRPTTGWLPGEVVSDAHRLRLPATLPPGRYVLIAGMYDAASGRRLETAGGDFVPLMQVVVGNG